MTLPLRQQLVSFDNDELIAVQDSDGTVYAAFARLCENLTLSREGQVRRIQRHDVLREGLVTLTVETTGGTQQTQCLKLSLVPLWLSGIQTSRIQRDDLREKVVRYQRDAADVLWHAFRTQIVHEGNEAVSPSDADIAQLQQIVEMGRAIMQMAQEQIDQRRRLDAAARVVHGLQREVADIHVRLDLLEEAVHPQAYISDVQAAEVASAVKSLAEYLTVHDPSKNHYQGIYMELYRRFSVSSYKLLRREHFTHVIAFLADWRTSGTRP